MPEPVTPQTVDLRLRFEPNRPGTYRSIAESSRAVYWEGLPEASKANVRQGRTITRVEVVFSQIPVAVAPDGQATLEIQIQQIKYSAQVADGPTMRIDTASASDAGSSLARLKGKTYRVRMTPSGRVVSVDTAQARTYIDPCMPDADAGLQILKDQAIVNRHTVFALATGSGTRSTGQTWSEPKVVSFDEMGARAFDKVYTLQAVHVRQGMRQAEVQMKGVPSGHAAQELYKGRQNPFSDRSDTNFTYTGHLTLDLDGGRVEQSLEQLEVYWVVAGFGQVDAEGQADPVRAKISSGFLYQLESVTPQAR